MERYMYLLMLLPILYYIIFCYGPMYGVLIAFKDYKIADIYWIVPISSKYEKFKRIEQDKINKYGHCNTIRFGTVLGRNTAFLIQNMCPATRKYLTAYIDKNKRSEHKTAVT
jgi:ABC-type polysaccharide transport system permease subunit